MAAVARDDRMAEMCRLCFSFRTDMHPLLDGGRLNVLAEMLASFATVQLSFGDGLPECVCDECVDLIKKCSSFKELCERSESVLRSCQSVNVDEIAVHINRKLDDYCFSQKITLCEKEEEDMYTCELYSEDGYHEPVSSEENSNSINDQTVANKKVKSKKPPNECDDGEEKTVKKVKLKLKLKKMQKPPTTDGKTKNKCCSYCGKKFRFLCRLQRHELIHRPEKLFSCHLCNKGFNESRSLNDHLKRHELRTEAIEKAKFKDCSEKESSYTCTICLLKFSSEGDLNIHSSVHVADGERCICNQCNKEFKTVVQLKRHVRIHLSDKPHKCTYCKKEFSEMGSLTRHMRNHTGEMREKKHICDICSKAYFDRHSLKVHHRTHTGEKPWECPDCGKRFIDCRLLKSHRKVHMEMKPFQCEICKKGFRHTSTLITHKRTHTGEKPYVCTVCGNSFIQSSNLTLHMRTHTLERPYSCKVCAKRFSSSSSLALHSRTHTGEKPYSCTVCSRRFARHDMKAHMRTHTGERPYKCHICSYRFSNLTQLQQHIRIHTGERPYVCSLCGKGCTTSFYLKKHILRTHGKNNVIIAPIRQNSEINDSCMKIEILPMNCSPREEKPNSDYNTETVQILNISNELNVMTAGGLTMSQFKTEDHEIVSAVETIVSDDIINNLDPNGLLKLN